MRFFLGSHMPNWMERTAVPLFVSRRRLAPRRSLPRAVGPWALDSGGFTELDLHGGWTVTARQYAGEVRRFADEIGNLEWASPQDWMNEPHMVRRTGLSVEEHQRRTVQNYLDLRALAPDLPFIPVVQGWTLDEYRRCVDLYDAAGVDLTRQPVVGVGSVCRRQAGKEAAAILFALRAMGLRLHAYGLKLGGLAHSADVLVSSDSMAWSSHARRRPPLPGCTHRSCANCLRYALRWRQKVQDRICAAAPSLFQIAA